MCKLLLKYLDRLLKQLDELTTKHKASTSKGKRLETIRKMRDQQWKIYFGNQAKVPDRIVSLHKPYVRPIIRGKEVKPVEFGAKINMLQVDGINFIEHANRKYCTENNIATSFIAKGKEGKYKEQKS